jgi:hypothetical protein
MIKMIENYFQAQCKNTECGLGYSSHIEEILYKAILMFSIS